jgi:hypothetical protein
MQNVGYTHAMSTRLQVVISDEETASLKAAAEREGVTVSEWVRRALREANRRQTVGSVEARLSAIRSASELEFPTADIDDMLAEIERGYVE